MAHTDELVRREIGEHLARAKGEWGIVFKRLPEGETLRFNAGKVFSAASLIKLPVLAAVMLAAEAGEVDLQERVRVEQSQSMQAGQDPGSGILARLDHGVELSVRDLCTLMIALSDNLATDLLITRVGAERINAALARIQLRDTRLDHALLDFNDLKGRNPTTAEDICRLLEMIYKGELPHSGLMLKMLEWQVYNSRLPLLLPFEEIEDGKLKVAHKTGTIKTVAHDAGIIRAGGKDYILCILSEGQEDVAQAGMAMAQLSRRIYDIVMRG